MHGSDCSESELSRISEGDEEENSIASDDASDSTNNSSKRLVSIAYPRGRSSIDQLLNRSVDVLHLGWNSLCGHLSRDGYDTREHSVNAKGLCLLIPFFLLFIFISHDYGRVVVRDIHEQNWANVQNPLNEQNATSVDTITVIPYKKEVNSLHFRRYQISERPDFNRDILVRGPETNLKSIRDSFETSNQCPSGILFLFHDCKRYAASFFYSPQGRQIVSMALDAGLLVVAVTKLREMNCWHQKDEETVQQISKKFITSRFQGVCKGEDGEDVYPPIFGFGVGSGGHFVAKLSSEMAKDPDTFHPFIFSAINIQNAASRENIRWQTPRIFTIMFGDEKIKRHITEMIQTDALAGNPVPTKVISTSGKKSIGKNHFLEIFADDPQMTESISNLIFQDLVTLNVVDPVNNMLTEDPSQHAAAIESIWQKYDLVARMESALQSLKIIDNIDIFPFGTSKRLMDCLTDDEISDANNIWLFEELNMAWDVHEVTAEGFGQVLAFFFEYGSPY